MIAKLLGWFLIIIGVIFLLRPEMLKNRMQKKSFKILKKYLFLIILAISVFFIVTALKSQGVLSMVLLIFGIIGIFKGLFFLKAKAAEKIVSWLLSRPVIFFRAGACFYIIFGAIILWFG